MTTIGICDDDTIELQRIVKLLTEYKRINPLYEINYHTFSAPLELLSHIEANGGFDILFLDIYMAGMLGTEVARELRSLGDHCEVVFMTSSKDHAIEAFEIDAAHYLIKPYSDEGVYTALDRIMKRISRDRRAMITVKTTAGMTRLALRDVVFTQTGRNNYQIIHTIQGKKFEVRMTATELFDLLSQNTFFVRCGASINLNLKYIRQISKDMIIFDTGEHLAYPYRSYQNLKQAFLQFQLFTEE